jgi:hypothetical protein
VWANIGQLHVTAGQTTALAWFALARLVRTRAWRWAVLLAVFTAWRVWAAPLGLFLALGLAGGVPVLLVLSGTRRVLPLVIAGVLTGLLVAPRRCPTPPSAVRWGARAHLPAFLSVARLSAVRGSAGYFARSAAACGRIRA